MGIAIGIGFMAGTLAGIMGMGGGMILVPAMVLLTNVGLMDVGQHTAQGVSLAVITLIAFLGALAHYRLGNVRLNVALWIIPAAAIFSFVGSMVADRLEASVLRELVGGLIIIVGVVTVIRDWRSGS